MEMVYGTACHLKCFKDATGTNKAWILKSEGGWMPPVDVDFASLAVADAQFARAVEGRNFAPHTHQWDFHLEEPTAVSGFAALKQQDREKLTKAWREWRDNFWGKGAPPPKVSPA